jgi:hypothetical protein
MYNTGAHPLTLVVYQILNIELIIHTHTHIHTARNPVQISFSPLIKILSDFSKTVDFTLQVYKLSVQECRSQ